MTALVRYGRSFDEGIFRPGNPEAEPERLHQLRHQTKNLLQAMILTLVDAGAQKPASMDHVVQDLVRRVHVTAAMADVLFGATGPRTTFEATLAALCQDVVTVFARGGRRAVVDLRCMGTCPQSLQRQILRAAHEMVGNAVKHGRPARGTQGLEGSGDGRIRIRFRRRSDAVSLTVHDQGPGFPDVGATRPGGGSRTLNHLARETGGRLSRRNAHGAVIRLVVPYEG